MLKVDLIFQVESWTSLAAGHVWVFSLCEAYLGKIEATLLAKWKKYIRARENEMKKKKFMHTN